MSLRIQVIIHAGSGYAKCANCGGSHGARADACAAKREARLSARGWRSPPPPWRERGARAPEGAAEAPGAPEDEVPTAQEGMEGETEVEVEVEPTLEEMEE